MNESNGVRNNISAPKVLLGGFAGVIILGTILLLLPFSTVESGSMGIIDAFFTATSAVCVTGLVVVDTGTYFTLFGQLVILLLIQIGGLGFMTIASIIAVVLGKRITLKERLLLQESLNQLSMQGIVKFTIKVILFSLIFEMVGATILALRFSKFFPWPRAIYYGFFHAISAFNNAGFDLMGNFSSLTGFREDYIVNFTVMGLIILGGLGFFVLVDIFNKKKIRTLTLHSKLVLATSFLLILFGFLVSFIFEFSGGFSDLSLPGKFLAALFQSVTTRTAGFNTIEIPKLRMATQFFLIILMFIGASPGSTGGGIKTTTFASLILAVKGILKSEEEDVIFERTLNKEIIKKSIAVTFVSLWIVIISTVSLALTEHVTFLTLLFEATSAFGTVGLSLGITPHLSLAGKMTIIFTMFAGRVGPLTLVLALAEQKKKPVAIKYVEEKITIG